MVGAGEVAGGRVRVERKHEVEEAAHLRVVVAGRVGHRRAERRRAGARDRRRVAVEGVERRDCGERVALPVVDADRVVHRLEHEAVADAQALVGRLHGEGVAAVGETGVAHGEAVEALAQRIAGGGALLAEHRLAAPEGARDRPVDHPRSRPRQAGRGRGLRGRIGPRAVLQARHVGERRSEFGLLHAVGAAGDGTELRAACAGNLSHQRRGLGHAERPRTQGNQRRGADETGRTTHRDLLRKEPSDKEGGR